MTKNASNELHLRLIHERHSALIKASKDLLMILAGEDLAQKKAVAQQTLQLATDLKVVLSNADIPAWLSNLLSWLPPFIAGNWKTSDLMINYVQLPAEIQGHTWTFEQGSEPAFDFDEIFNHFKKESRLPDLFDEIVRLLHEIESCGDVDSITMLNALGKVISTIKRCKNGSYFSLNAAWDFLLSFLNNYMWGELSKLPVLGTALDALKKTLIETEEEMSKVHKQIQDEMMRRVGSQVKALANKSTFPFMTYDRSGHLVTGNLLLSRT